MNDKAKLFYYDDIYGYAHIPGHGTEEGDRGDMMERYAKVLCVAAAGDGEASPQEVAWIQGYLSIKDYADDIVSRVPEWSRKAESKSLEEVGLESKELLDYPGLQVAGRVIIYDALRAAGADGLDRRELEAIKVIAQSLGVSEEDVDKIKDQVLAEKDMKKQRIKLLYPNGYSALRPEYQP